MACCHADWCTWLPQGSVATGDIGNSVLFMAFFGLGTLPVMWSVAFFWQLCQHQYQAKNTQSLSLYDDADGLPAYT